MSRENTPEHLIKLAKNLRRNQTDAEASLWQLLRNRQIANAKFRRQNPVEGYIADFYCHEHKLVIELDGGQHFTDEGIRQDAARTERLNRLGIDVLRFDNRQVLLETEAVLQLIHDRLIAPASPHPSPLPEGEGVKDTIFDAGTSNPLPLGDGVEDAASGVRIYKPCPFGRGFR